jgi:hypothetical protein
VNGQTCPRCSGFATVEPGGLRCSRCGHTPMFRRILPRDHWLSGRDWRNWERQRALDCSLVRAGRVEEYIFAMLERLEGHHEPAVKDPREWCGISPGVAASPAASAR